MTDRKKPGVAFWATVVMVGLVLYVLSYGPALVLANRKIVRQENVWVAYRPLVIATYDGPGWVSEVIVAYGNFWAGGASTSRVQFIEWEHRLHRDLK